jgi:hypothetical protein
MTPLRAIWLTTIVSVLPGLLDLASPIAANAIFSLTAMALDLSYIIPIFLRRIFHNHPEVMFKPGPFYMGDGFLGKFCNWICIAWTLFIVVIFSLPTIRPVTAQNMNYASVSISHAPCFSEPLLMLFPIDQVITIGVLVLSGCDSLIFSSVVTSLTFTTVHGTCSGHTSTTSGPSPIFTKNQIPIIQRLSPPRRRITTAKTKSEHHTQKYDDKGLICSLKITSPTV